MHDVERNAGGLGEAGAAKGSGDDLVVTAAGTEEILEFTKLATEAVGCVVALEATPPSDPALDAAMILLGSPIANDKSGPARWMER